MRERTPEENLRVLGWLLHLAGTAATALLVLVVALAMLRPVGREIERSQAARAEVEALLVEAPTVRREHLQVRSELARLRAQKALLRQRITDGPSEDEFLRQVSTAAEQSRLQLREYRPGNSDRQGDYGLMTIHLDGEGTHTSICQFLDALAQLPRLSKVQRVQVSSSNQSVTYPVSLAVEIFFAAHPEVSAVQEKQHANRAG